MSGNMIKFDFESGVPYYFVVVDGDKDTAVFVVNTRAYKEEENARMLSDRILAAFDGRLRHLLWNKKKRVEKKTLHRFAKRIKLIRGDRIYAGPRPY
ncbi:MAG: hypothetical protein J6S14_11355 [Clostridia bacterium]|nr:hypothetical protein [Clostridia bacterium]